MNKNETRPTPETDALIARMSDDGLDLYDREDELKDHARKLERERDEALQKSEIWAKQVQEAVRQVEASDALYRRQCEEIARLQTMAASVADVIAKRDAMLEAIREAHDALSTSLRQWVLYADERADEDLESAKHTEGQLYRLGQSTLDKLKPFLP